LSLFPLFPPQQPEISEGFLDIRGADTFAGVGIGDWNLDPVEVMHEEPNFRLEEMRPAAHAMIEHGLHCAPRKELEPAAHIPHPGAEHQIGENGPAAADEMAVQGTGVRSARDETGSAGEIDALVCGFDKSGISSGL